MPPFFELSSPKRLILEKPKSIEYKNFFSATQALVSFPAWLLITLLFQIFVILLFTTCSPQQVLFIRPQRQHHHHHQQQQQQHVMAMAPPTEQCTSGLVYVYDLPPIFNKELLENCNDLDPWNSRCTALSHHGFGPKANGLSHIVPEDLAPAWYWTDMFAGEVIYHARIANYKCRTSEPELATAFYIPFYAGLAVGKFLFTNYSAIERDWQCEKLNAWLQDQPFWRRSNGSDHFIMLGRMTWDFRRTKNEDWGSSFLNMPVMKEMLRLSVERSPWDHLEISVPYPTGFHPRSNSDIAQWQRFVRDRKRTSLFTFVGGKRKVKNDFRALLLNHCYNEPGSCRVVDCSTTPCQNGTSAIFEAFLDSNFCLQPRGDAYTRRSMFDCMLAGTIPVFFWERSIRGQYEWFLTDGPEGFSVFIDRNDVRNGTSIRRLLEGYSAEEINRMREKVISLIPRFVYGLPSDGADASNGDAFDIAIEGVLRKFKEQRRVENLGFQMEQ